MQSMTDEGATTMEYFLGERNSGPPSPVSRTTSHPLPFHGRGTSPIALRFATASFTASMISG